MLGSQNWILVGLLLAVVVGACAKPTSQKTVSPTGATETPQAEPAPISAETAAACWPRFHGPKGDNISPEKRLLKKWPAAGPKLLWTGKGIGEGFSSPSIALSTIFISGSVNDKTTITALDLNGRVKWQTPLDEAWKGDPPGARSTPTINGDRLYHESPLGLVTCLDAKTGKKIWDVNILKQFDAANITWGMAESVLIDGDHVICCPGGKRTSVVALDKNTGKKVWVSGSAGDPANYATPALAEYRGLRILLTMSQRALIGVNADNGELLFRHLFESKQGVNAISPICHDGRIFITSGYGTGSEMLKLVVDGKKASVESVWKSKELDNHHGGVILLNGYLYGAAHYHNVGRWICLAWDDGAMKYAEKGVGKGSLTCADGMLYCWGENGQVALVPAVPERHDRVSEFTVASGGEGPRWAHPVICGGRLYLRHGDLLHAYDIRAEKVKPQ